MINNHKIKNAIWLSWHFSRRSKSFSTELAIPFIARQIEGGFLKRHLISLIWSIYVLLRRRPKIVFIQYSFLLLFGVISYKILSRKPVLVVCDCHTKALRRNAHASISLIFNNIKMRMFNNVDLFLLANKKQRNDLSVQKPYLVIPDPIPTLLSQRVEKQTRKSIVFVCSFDTDEPINEIVSAAEALALNYSVYITGDSSKVVKDLKKDGLVIYTGFMKDSEYISLLSNADCIISLTTEEDCLQSTGYEALSLNRPFVTTNTIALKEYFGDSIFYCENKVDSIVDVVNLTLQDKHATSRISKFKRAKKVEVEILIFRLASLIVNRESQKTR